MNNPLLNISTESRSRVEQGLPGGARKAGVDRQHGIAGVPGPSELVEEPGAAREVERDEPGHAASLARPVRGR